MNENRFILVSSKEQKKYGYYLPLRETQAKKEREKTRIIQEFKKNNPKYADLDILAFINKDFVLKRCKPWGIAELIKVSENEKQHPYTILSQYSSQCRLSGNLRLFEEGV